MHSSYGLFLFLQIEITASSFFFYDIETVFIESAKTMGLREWTDTIDRSDIAILYEFSEMRTREPTSILPEKSENEILRNSYIVDSQARDIEETRLETEISEFLSLDSSLFTHIREYTVHIFHTWFFSCPKGSEVYVIVPYSDTFIRITCIENQSTWDLIVAQVYLHSFLMSDDRSAWGMTLDEQDNNLPVELLDGVSFSLTLL